MRQRRAALALLLPVVASTAQAQRAVGAGEDAWTLPRGALRFTIAAAFENLDERFLPNGRRQSLDALASGIYDASRLGVLVPGQNALRALTGLPGARLSLGGVSITADQRVAVLPMGLDVGLARWLQVGIMVPYVRTRTDVVARANDARDSATAGLNPALGTASALQTNTLLVRQLLAAARAREAGAGLGDGACSGASAPACAAVNDARAAAGDLATLYGTDVDDALGTLTGTRGSAAVPLAGTDAAAAVDARIARLRDALGADGQGITVAAPAHAQVPIAAADLRAFITDPAAGLGLDAFQLVERSHVGDVEASVKVKLLDRIGPLGAEATSPIGLRAAVTGLVRAPTGQSESPGNALDVGAGDGQTDVEVRGALDVTIGRAFWVTGALRVVRQLEDQQFVRAPLTALEVPLVPATATVRARRDLGDAVAMEITPRWMPNGFMAVSATYQIRRKESDSYTLADGATAPEGRDVALLGVDTDFTEHRAGFALTWSTLNAARRGRRTIPLDVSYVRAQSVRATGGIVPAVRSDAIQLRLWWGAARP